MPNLPSSVCRTNYYNPQTQTCIASYSMMKEKMSFFFVAVLVVCGGGCYCFSDDFAGVTSVGEVLKKLLF